MSVKNHIAAFEAHNENVRLSSPTASPARASSPRDHSKMFGFENVRNSGREPSADLPIDPEGRPETASTVSSHSATDLAAQSRRNRLLKEHGATSLAENSASGSKPAVSLSERRKARQQRKQQMVQKRVERGIDPPTAKAESRQAPPSNPAARSQIRQQPEPLTSNRRVDHSVSSESYGPDEAMRTPNAYRVSPARRAKAQRMQRGATDSPSPGVNSEEDENTNFNSLLTGTVDATDDEATLTSVRQIMKTPASLNQPSLKDELSRVPDVLRTASSSSLEADARDALRYRDRVPQSSSLPPRPDDDDTLLDYADLFARAADDDDNSVRYEARKREAERRKLEEGFIEEDLTSPLVNKEDVEHYRRALDTPVAKTAAGVIAAATVGTIVLGPVGLLVGAATVGIAVGIMQIPEEQRNNMKEKAAKALKQAHESALDASETLSSSCANSCRDHSDQLPREVHQCFREDDINTTTEQDTAKKASTEDLTESEKGTNGSGRGAAFRHDVASSPGVGRNRRVACLRKVRITPVGQIHGLDPQQQPKAWLDVLASANTTPEEKVEAMEEILILAKDKRHARILLDEGILDSLMYILNRYFDATRRGTASNDNELARAKLAANCCVTLGKAHCAAVHTEGDLLLMSMYDRGTVPEERQLAQMLYEVPYHVLSQEPDVFVIKQVSMPLAEDMALSIKDLATL